MGQVPGTLANINLTYIRTVLLYASECWAPNVNDLLKLQRNDRAMIRWTFNVRLKDHISSDSLLRKLGINNIQTLLRYNRLRWFGHVVRNDGCINSITEFEVVGQRGRGRPKKTWKDTINNDLTLEAIKGRSRKQNGVEKETQNKHRSSATHFKWN